MDVPPGVEFDQVGAEVVFDAPTSGGGESCDIGYYISLITSLYRTKPKFIAWLTALLTPLCQTNSLLKNFDAAFDLDQAVGVQLDILGQLIGVSRTVQFQPPGTNGGVIQSLSLSNGGSGYSAQTPFGPGDSLVLLAGNNNAVVKVKQVSLRPVVGRILAFTVSNPGSGYAIQNNVPTTGGHGTGATFNITAVSAATSAILEDGDYRILLKAKIMQNQWDGRANSLYASWQQLFPGGQLSIQDNQNMTATVIATGAFSDVTKSLIENGYIVPRPQGVLYTYVFPTLPAFGFDGDHTFIAGFDEGHWT
jgi:hypothetical protein